jgi:hypothetical protein
VEHILRSLKKTWSGAHISWSGVVLIDLFGYFFMEWNYFLVDVSQIGPSASGSHNISLMEI